MNGNGAKAVRVGFGRCALAWTLLAAAARAETVAIEGRAAEAVEAQTGDVVTPASARQDGYPEAVGTPAFWLDASDAGNWTRMGDDVTFIPSKTASAVALKCRPDVEKGLPPVFVSDEAEIATGGGTALDFGKTGSKRGALVRGRGERRHARRAFPHWNRGGRLRLAERRRVAAGRWRKRV